MSWRYSCPKCDASLNPKDFIILIGSVGARRLLIGFHPQPGNYEFHAPPGVQIAEGERWDFCCPVCQQSLVSADDENLCALQLEAPEGRRQVLFSRIAGEQATFVVADRRIEQRYGDRAEEYARHLAHLKYLL